MSTPRNWWVGLACRICGQRVKGKTGGVYVRPILPSGKACEPWAEHAHCRESPPATRVPLRLRQLDERPRP